MGWRFFRIRRLITVGNDRDDFVFMSMTMRGIEMPATRAARVTAPNVGFLQ
jgi:hypothetical protein